MRSPHALIANSHNDWSWLYEVHQFYKLDDEALGDLIGVFFADRNRLGLSVEIPDWTDALQGKQIDHCTWRRRSLPVAPITAAFLAANYFLIQRARTFAAQYFKEHGLEIVGEIGRKARRAVHVDDLLASV